MSNIPPGDVTFNGPGVVVELINDIDWLLPIKVVLSVAAIVPLVIIT